METEIPKRKKNKSTDNIETPVPSVDFANSVDHTKFMMKLSRAQWRLLINILNTSEDNKRYTSFDLYLINNLINMITPIEENSKEEFVSIELNKVEFGVLESVFMSYSSFLNTKQIRELVVGIYEVFNVNR